MDITDVNEPPVLTAATFAIDDNSPVGTLVGNITAADPDQVGMGRAPRT